MNAYTDADRAYYAGLDAVEKIHRIYERLMTDRDVVREAVIETRSRHPRAKRGGEFRELVMEKVLAIAEEEFDNMQYDDPRDE